MAARPGELAYNLWHAETLATEALQMGAKIVALPEFFTTPCYVHPRVHEAIVGPENPAKDMLVRLACQHRAYVGGSMLMRRGADVYNTYCLAGLDYTITTEGAQPEYYMFPEPVMGRGDGSQELCWSTGPDVGRIVPHVLAHPLSRKAVCPVAATACWTFNELLDLRERSTGCSRTMSSRSSPTSGRD